jgi:hypothetical protein
LCGEGQERIYDEFSDLGYLVEMVVFAQPSKEHFTKVSLTTFSNFQSDSKLLCLRDISVSRFSSAQKL